MHRAYLLVSFVTCFYEGIAARRDSLRTSRKTIEANHAEIRIIAHRCTRTVGIRTWIESSYLFSVDTLSRAYYTRGMFGGRLKKYRCNLVTLIRVNSRRCTRLNGGELRCLFISRCKRRVVLYNTCIMSHLEDGQKPAR